MKTTSKERNLFLERAKCQKSSSMNRKIQHMIYMFNTPEKIVHLGSGFRIVLTEGRRMEIITFYNDGVIASHEFFNKKNKHDGRNINYYPNGKIARLSHWKNGKMQGEFRQYDVYGKLRIACRFDNGRAKEKVRRWDRSGKLMVSRSDRLKRRTKIY
jgi:antitoxin component YwqK of YwqJK toxin-antitoxin module